MKCFLVTGYLSDAIAYDSIKDAKADFECSARELDSYGQKLGATIHIAKSRKELQDYPDYALSLSPRGALHCQRA